MIRQLVNALVVVSMLLSPFAAFAGKNEGAAPPKNKCNEDFVNRLWKSDNEDLKDEFRNYWRMKKADRPMDGKAFCHDIEARLDGKTTESSTCPDGPGCPNRNRPSPNVESLREVNRATQDQYADARPPRHAPLAPQQDFAPQNSGGGFFGGGGGGGGQFMGMLMGGLMGFGIASALMGGQQQNQMYPMPHGGPPRFAPLQRPQGPLTAPWRPPGLGGPGMPMPYGGGYGGGYGGAPGVVGAGGYGGAMPYYGGVQQYNGAQIYNGGGYQFPQYQQSPPPIIYPNQGYR